MTKYSEAELGGLCPRLVDGVEPVELPDGNLRLDGPPFKRGRLRRIMARLCQLPERARVDLDDIGSFVVRRFDGRDMDTLAAELAVHLKLDRREAQGALGLFLRSLIKRRLVVVPRHGDGR